MKMANETTIIERARYGVEMEILKDAADTVTFEDVIEKHLEDARGRASADFIPYRLVTNLNIPYLGEQVIDPPIKLRVYFTYNDLKHLRRPKLAYWKSNQWKFFNEIGQFPLPGNHVWAGYLEVEFQEWGDPPIALGS
jgi:hypothetical protein